MVFYAPFTGFSGTTLYDSYLLVLYNLVFTSLPVLVAGTFDVDVYASTVVRVPSLYAIGVQGNYFNSQMLVAWLFRGILHACFNFGVSYILFGSSAQCP